MLENATLQHLEKFCKFAEDCTSMTFEEQKVQYQVEELPKDIKYTILGNLTYYRLDFNINNKITLIDNNDNKILNILTVMSHTLLTYENIVNRLMNILDIGTKEEFVNRVKISGEYTIHLYQGLNFIGNTESQFGKGYLYATSGYGTHTKKQRYDYIMVKVRDSNNNEYDQAAQLLAIFNI